MFLRWPSLGCQSSVQKRTMGVIVDQYGKYGCFRRDLGCAYKKSKCAVCKTMSSALKMYSRSKNIALLIDYPNHKILNFRLFLCILQTSPSLSHSLHTLRFQRKNRNQVCKPERNKNSRVCICHTFHTGLWSLVNIRKISTFFKLTAFSQRFCEVFKVSFPY